jgi:anti-sigma regulatory factor (Ser/Thr protein kinase)
MTADFALIIPARPENIALVRHALTGYVGGMEAVDGRVADVMLAVTEACSNVVVHAYPAGGGPLEVEASAPGAGSLQVRVRDHGCGIAPRVDSPGLGLGLPVMMSVSDAVDINTVRGGGTEVAMTFSLAGR